MISAKHVIINWPITVKAFDPTGNLGQHISKWSADDQNVFLFRAMHPDKEMRTRMVPYSEGTSHYYLFALGQSSDSALEVYWDRKGYTVFGPADDLGVPVPFVKSLPALNKFPPTKVKAKAKVKAEGGRQISTQVVGRQGRAASRKSIPISVVGQTVFYSSFFAHLIL